MYRYKSPLHKPGPLSFLLHSLSCDSCGVPAVVVGCTGARLGGTHWHPALTGHRNTHPHGVTLAVLYKYVVLYTVSVVYGCRCVVCGTLCTMFVLKPHYSPFFSTHTHHTYPTNTLSNSTQPTSLRQHQMCGISRQPGVVSLCRLHHAVGPLDLTMPGALVHPGRVWLLALPVDHVVYTTYS